MTTQVEDLIHRAPRGSQQLLKAQKRLIIAAITVALSGLVSADSRGINFEASQGYQPGSVQDQPFFVTPPPEGWGGSVAVPLAMINPAIDQQVTPFFISNPPPTFGAQTWRISNFNTTPTATDQPFSPSLTDEAGETKAQNGGYSGGVRKNHFEAQWDFATVDPIPPSTETNLFATMSPDRGDGARMSYIRLETHPAGTDVWFREYQDNGLRGQYGSSLTAALGCGAGDGFKDIKVATAVTVDAPHTVKLAIDFVDGPHNDVVKVYVDGTLRHTGTTWEDYYRWCPPAGGSGSSADQPRTVDSMSFRVEGPGLVPNFDTFGFGYFIDNLVYSSNRVGHECDDHRAHGDGDVEDGKGKHGHSHFNKECCDNRAGDDVEHDDDQGHHFKSTSVNLAEYLVTPDGRKVTITGIGLDNGLPVAFTLIVVDHDGALPANYTIILTNGYTFVGKFVRGIVSVE